ncbi:PREDICTED: putative lipase ROG1 isoform X1 [Tarenaya hassleriana]|uniref:putative lipase ROG1 isoform X1 n=1 Tax=Tarenaya hassleriana TaxID=28532 RepID=UPI00053C0D3D|nr:PREDICTED: putative lipase ROG1 isoform X1 [Tarenaya hassleriana]
MEEVGKVGSADREEDERGSDRENRGAGKKKTTMKKTKTKRSGKRKGGGKKNYWMGCLRVESDERGNVDMTVDFPGERAEPTHLVVMVNGLIGSAQNWRFAAKQLLKKYPEDLLVHCSKRNYSMLTFDGVDVMGQRLAEEVRSVIERHPSLRKISFVGHSLGGLIARYAIACLYEQETRDELAQNNDHPSENIGDSHGGEGFKGRIAKLEPINFITSAAPHLGSRGHKQVPLFGGLYTLERFATRISWCLGRTGKHLFLADKDDGKPPLLLQMVSDNEDLKFISALQCFKRCVAYANTSFDHLVGWSTSSIRRHNELPKLQRRSVSEKYPHIVNVEPPATAINRNEDLSEANPVGFNNFDMEEEMIRGLTKLRWERIDVNFRGSIQRFLAHNTIQVKTKCINDAGTDVIQHMNDNFMP